MGYYINLSELSLDQYQEKLVNTHLLPSRMILRDNINAYFTKFKALGIEHIGDLFDALKTKVRVQEFSLRSGVDLEYLTLLIREIKSLLSKPNLIKNFSGISLGALKILDELSIKNTEKLFYKLLTPTLRQVFQKETGINSAEVLMLTQLCDLSRVRWVNHTFANMLLDVGIHSLDDLVHANPEKLHAEINRINREQDIYHGKIGLNDINLCIDAAKEVPFEIEY